MKGGKGGLLLFSLAGMELSWLYAWAAFVMNALCHRPFPFPEAIAAFALAAALTFFVRGKGWRVIQVLGLQALCLILVSLRIVYAYHCRSYAFFSPEWAMELLGREWSPFEWVTLALLLFWGIAFWVGGVNLARRPPEYMIICSRFDLGVGAIFVLLLIKLIMLVKAGIKYPCNVDVPFLFSFFLFALPAIGMGRNRSDAQKDFLDGYKGIGVIMSFTVFLLLFGTGAVFLSWPYLTSAAEAAYGALKSAAGPLEPVLISVLRFLFVSNRSRLDPRPSSNGIDEDLGASSETGPWTEVLQKFLGIGLLGLGGLILTLICGVGIWFLIRWLLSRTPGGRRMGEKESLIFSWVMRFRLFMLFCWAKIVQGIRGLKGAGQLYAALICWGRHSAVSHFPNETPSEYGLRLMKRFPALKMEIETIIEGYHWEVYGEGTLTPFQMSSSKLAWRRLRSPRRWPSRLKNWFVLAGDKGHPLPQRYAGRDD
jgi:hypothetical protein